MTPKQKLQKDRAWFKFVVMGLNKPVSNDSLTKLELEKWNEILDIRKSLLLRFDNCSRVLGLNVPEHKCWCGKEAKYLQVREGWVCKRHKNEN